MLYIWNQVYQDLTIKNLIDLKQQQATQQQKQQIVTSLICFAEKNLTTNYVVKEYIVRKICQNENCFSNLCKTQTKFETILEVAQNDILEIQQQLLNHDWKKEFGNQSMFCFENYKATKQSYKTAYGYEESIEKIVMEQKTKKLLENVIEHYMKFGTGITAQYSAFCWNKNKLCEIDEVDEINFDQLMNIEYQKRIIIQNTSEFLDGNQANNVLLCGSMGSGKSSCVKALLNFFKKQNLKIVEITKTQLNTIDELVNQIKDQTGKFIVFLDDLSFEGDDENYKSLKVVLDGQLQKRAKNILFYATSNRRNLVRDNWSERGQDVSETDTQNEKYSLTERFGIKLSFACYDQNEYLAIVEKILLKNKVEFTGEAKVAALAWEKDYHGRSGRTANNFANSYIKTNKQ